MSAHHDNHDNHSNESKPVAFLTPIILGLVTVLIMVLAVNASDAKHHDCECSEPCATEMEHGKSDHHAGAAHEHATDAADHSHSDTTKAAH